MVNFISGIAKTITDRTYRCVFFFGELCLGFCQVIP